MIVKINDYKIAKQFSVDVENIMKAINLTSKALSYYQHYKPVKKILNTLIDEKAILEAHLSTAQKLLNRGKDNG